MEKELKEIKEILKDMNETIQIFAGMYAYVNELDDEKIVNELDDEKMTADDLDDSDERKEKILEAEKEINDIIKSLEEIPGIKVSISTKVECENE